MPTPPKKNKRKKNPKTPPTHKSTGNVKEKEETEIKETCIKFIDAGEKYNIYPAWLQLHKEYTFERLREAILYQNLQSK